MYIYKETFYSVIINIGNNCVILDFKYTRKERVSYLFFCNMYTEEESYEMYSKKFRKSRS